MLTSVNVTKRNELGSFFFYIILIYLYRKFMYTREELENPFIDGMIVNLSGDDPEEIYVTKWKIEERIKEKDPSYIKKSLSQFISDLNLGSYVYVHDDVTVPFTVYMDYLFVATGNYNEDINDLSSALEDIKFDLKSLHKQDLYKMFTTGKEDDPSRYFVIDGQKMVSPDL